MIYLCMAAAVFVGDLFIKNHMERSLADGKERKRGRKEGPWWRRCRYF